QKKYCGHPYSSVWKYFTREEKVAKGKYKVTYNLCRTLGIMINQLN
ncbi:21721_t:CDS:1, partial [Cetraspora pellucida]